MTLTPPVGPSRVREDVLLAADGVDERLEVGAAESLQLVRPPEDTPLQDV